MNQKEAYEEGKHYGYLAARYLELDDITDEDWADGGDLREAMELAAFEVELGARQFSPWEFVAHDINTSEPEWRVEGLWESYDKGVEVGIRKGVRERIKELK